MRRFILLLTMFALTVQGFAQNEKSTNLLKKIASTESNLNWMRIETKQTTNEFIEVAKTIFELDENADLTIIYSETDEMGWTHHRIQQMQNNIPIEGAEYILHENEGTIKKANGKLVKNFSAKKYTSISKTLAIEGLLKKVNAKKYAWQDTEYENLIKSQKNDLDASFYPEAELVYFSTDFSTDPKDYILTYKIDVFSIEPLERFWYYIDAQTGEIIDKLTRIHTNCHNGTGSTNYYGTRNITTCKQGNSYNLRHDCSANDGIETYNSNNSRNWPRANFTDNDNNWNSNSQKTGVEAHWGTQITYDYFRNTHNRNSFDNNGAKLQSWVHFGEDFVNAFWNGSFMTYGDGNGSSYGPLTCLDVVAHEITHAITERTARLVYRNESGALNESFSDIFGTAIELLYDPNVNDRDWLMGEDANLTGSGFRNMQNPNAKGDPDTYNGDHWHTGNGDYGGVHTNSGVQNFWFYLLTEGGSGTNDLGVNYNVQGIGLAKAAKIAYRNLTTKLTRYSTYDDAKNGAIEAAEELYGANSNEVEQVKNAWCAVGAGNCNTSARGITITSPNGGESISGSHNITWNSVGTINNVIIDYSLNRGGTWNRLIASTENDGSYLWNVPNVQTGIALIRITATDDFSVRDESNNTFSIKSCTLKALFTFNAASLCANNSITYTNQSYDFEVLGNASYKWFVDGVFQTSNTNFTTNFSSAGSRTIILEASYNNGCTNKYAYRMYIQPPPTADFMYDQKNGFNVELTANQANATSYSWTSNGTNIGNSKIISNNFSSTGNYNVCLTTNSPCGSANICRNVQVVNPCTNVNANFTTPASNCADDISFFSNTSSGASSYQWYVNGVFQSSLSNLSYQFPAKGNYTVSLVASNTNGCSDTRNQTVTVSPNASEINPSNDVFDCDASNATLFAGVSNMQNYQWLLNGAIVGNTQNLTVNNSGEYLIRVTDKCGNQQTRSVLIALNDTECVWPGDLNFDQIVNHQDLVYLGMHYGARGLERPDQKINWEAKASVPWGSSLFNDPTKDMKHVDANGNGHVDFADFAAIVNNWEQTHNDDTDLSPSLVPGPSPMVLNLVPQHIPSLDGGDDLLIVDINVESDANDGVALYGGYFEIDLDQFSPIVNYVEFSLDDQSWFFEDAFNTVYVQKYNPATNKLEVAFTQLDQSDQIGSGKIGQAIIEITNVGTGGVTEVFLNDVQFNNSNGNLLPLHGDTLIVNFGDPSTCENNWTIDANTPYQDDYKASNAIQTDGTVHIVNGNDISYKASRVTLNNGFSTKPGAKFNADSSQPCSTLQKTDEANDTSETIQVDDIPNLQNTSKPTNQDPKYPIHPEVPAQQPAQDLKD